MSWLYEIIWSPLDIAYPDLIARTLLATFLGAVVGFERELHDRPAGLRTHALTALAASIFTIVTFEIVARAGATDGTNSDPVRIIEAVTTGVAFLAAGAIIRSGTASVRGLTTGAGLWMTGAIGVACGTGLLQVAILGAVITAFLLVVVRRFERDILDTKKARDNRHSD